MLATACAARVQYYFYTDASSTHGIGGYLLRAIGDSPTPKIHLCQQITTTIGQEHISVLEMLAILEALRRCLSRLAGDLVVIHAETGISSSASSSRR